MNENIMKATKVIASLMEEYISDLRKSGKGMTATLVQQAAQNALNVITDGLNTKTSEVDKTSVQE